MKETLPGEAGFILLFYTCRNWSSNKFLCLPLIKIFSFFKKINKHSYLGTYSVLKFYSVNQRSHESDEKRNDQETVKNTEGNETITYSELLTSDDDCPLSSLLNLPLSKGITTNTPSLPSSTATLPPSEEQFIPLHYSYPPVRFQ